MNKFSSAIYGVAGLCVGVLITSIIATPRVEVNVPTSIKEVENTYYRNGFSKYLMKKVNRYRECYNNFTTRLDKEGSLGKTKEIVDEGLVTFIFEIEEDGELASYKLLYNELSDDNLPKCISDNFEGISFAPPPLGISKYRTFDFSFLREETYKEKLKEKKNFPQIVPTNGIDKK